jgi:prevent-host-death family protein
MISMAEVNVHEAKTHFSRLLQRVAAGEEIIIARAGQPVARLVPIAQPPRRVFGVDRGLYEIPEGFDAPLPDALQNAFEGEH